MTSVAFFLIAVFFVVVQSTLFPILPEWLGRPDFLFVLVAFSAFRFGWVQGLIYAFLIGWMTDVVSGIYLGVFPLQNVLVFSALKLIAENSPLKEATYQIPLVSMSYFVTKMAFYFVYVLSMPGNLSPWLWGERVRETCILLLASIPLFIILSRLYEKFSTKRVFHRVVRKSGGNQFRMMQ